MDEDLLRELHKLREDARLSDPEYAGPETLRGRVKMWERSNLPGTSAGVRVNSWSDHFGEDWLNVRLGDETLERWFFRAQSDCASDLSSWVAAREEALWGLAGLHWNTVQSELVDRAFSVLAALWEWKKTPESTAPTGGTENELLEAERRRVEGQYWPDMRTRNEWVAGRAGKACVPGEMVDARVAVGWETEFRDEWLSNRLLRIPGVDAHVAEFAVNGLMLIVTQKERQIFLRNRKVEERQSALLDEDLLLNGELLEQSDYVTCGGMNAPGVFFRDAVEADVHLDMNLAQLDRLSMCARAWEYPRRLVSPWSLVSPVVPDLAEQGKTVGAWIELAVNGIEFWDELVPWMRRATVLNKDRDSLGVLVQYLGNAVSHYENTAVEEEKERLASQIEESCRIVGLIGLVRFGNAGDGPRSG